jgi:septum formation protein
MAVPLILASASPSRRHLLHNAGLRFVARPSGVDEEQVKQSLLAERADAREIATTLAELKAVRVSARHPEALVIGADSTLVCDGRLFDKPPTLADARRQLLALAGRTHELWSAVVVARGGARLWHHAEFGRLTMLPANEPFIDRYLRRVGQAACTSVGAYQLEGLGVHLFSRIEGDFFTVLGLPLLPLLSFLSDHGIGLEEAA